MIPKTIHYCWFGHNTLPKLANYCINSWKKFLPDYTIKCWDESNFDIHCCPYVEEAYQKKKWAFVSDYARFYILYQYGGIYFDTDVELIKPLDDLISHGGFMGIEQDSQQEITVAPGLGIASKPASKLYQELLQTYHKSHFINPNKTLNETTVGTYTTEVLKKYGLKNITGIQQVLDVYIYPKEYFNPIDHITGRLIITPNTYAIHHYMASWCTQYSKKRGKIYQFLARNFGKRTADTIKNIWKKLKKYIEMINQKFL